jgi:ribosomal protein L31E
MEKIVYEVFIYAEHENELIYNLRDQYTKWFDSRRKAIKYAKSIKKVVKKAVKNETNNLIEIEVNEYYISNLEDMNEEFMGVVYDIVVLEKFKEKRGN